MCVVICISVILFFKPYRLMGQNLTNITWLSTKWTYKGILDRDYGSWSESNAFAASSPWGSTEEQSDSAKMFEDSSWPSSQITKSENYVDSSEIREFIHGNQEKPSYVDDVGEVLRQQGKDSLN